MIKAITIGRPYIVGNIISNPLQRSMTNKIEPTRNIGPACIMFFNLYDAIMEIIPQIVTTIGLITRNQIANDPVSFMASGIVPPKVNPRKNTSTNINGNKSSI